jgi:Interferon-related developmental regulator (IFRD)
MVKNSREKHTPKTSTAAGKKGGKKKGQQVDVDHTNGGFGEDNSDRDDDIKTGYTNANIEYLPEDHTLMSEGGNNSLWSGEDGDDLDDDDDYHESSIATESDDYLLSTNKSRPAAATRISNEEARMQRLQDALRLLQEYSSEKRTVRREQILKRVFKAMTQFGAGFLGATAIVENSTELHKATCLIALRIGSPAEQYAACRVLEAGAIAMAPADTDFDDWYEQIAKYLLRLIRSPSKAVTVRAAALRALCLTHYIAIQSNDGVNRLEVTHQLLDTCTAYIVDVDSTENQNPLHTPIFIRSTAFDCWSLLATTMPDFTIVGVDDYHTGRGLDLLETISSCLQETSVQSTDLRASAGECATLIHEAKLRLFVLSESEADDSNNGSGSAVVDVPDVDIRVKQSLANHYHFNCWSGTSYEVVMDEISQRIQELSTESSKYLSKKTKKEQRATFREYVATMVDNEPAPETDIIAIRNVHTFTVSSWRDIVVLNFMRQCLQSGFQIHALANPVMQSIFRLSPQVLQEHTSGASGVAGLSSVEKRLIQSKSSETSKLADLHLKKQRHKRQHVKNHFLTADGDDL